MPEECKKTKFRNQEAAEFYISKHKSTSLTERKLYTYLCPHCYSWHLTSNKQVSFDAIKEYKSILKEKNKLISSLQKELKECKKQLKEKNELRSLYYRATS